MAYEWNDTMDALRLVFNAAPSPTTESFKKKVQDEARERMKPKGRPMEYMLTVQELDDYLVPPTSSLQTEATDAEYTDVTDESRLLS